MERRKFITNSAKWLGAVGVGLVIGYDQGKNTSEPSNEINGFSYYEIQKIAQKEVATNKEMVAIFDEIFLSMKSAQMTYKLPNNPGNYHYSDVEVAEFSSIESVETLRLLSTKYELEFGKVVIEEMNVNGPYRGINITKKPKELRIDPSRGPLLVRTDETMLSFSVYDDTSGTVSGTNHINGDFMGTIELDETFYRETSGSMIKAFNSYAEKHNEDVSLRRLYENDRDAYNKKVR